MTRFCNTRAAMKQNMGAVCIAFVAVVLTFVPSLRDWLKDEPYQLRVDSLTFESGRFVQTVSPVGATVLQGEWSASIFTADGDFLCGDGGNGSYDGRTKRFSPDDWTGDDCPSLRAGESYRASASWSNTDQFGASHTVGFEFEFSGTE